MGGFTVIYLKNRSEENIKKHNELLKKFGVAKKYRFYSLEDVKFEYDSFLKNLGVFPEHSFPKDKIKTFNDFCKYWSPDALGEIFVPFTGSLSFDCYFGRTSKRAMKAIGKYLNDNHKDILAVSGSFDTFMERGMTKYTQKLFKELINQNTIRDTNNIKRYDPYETVY